MNDRTRNRAAVVLGIVAGSVIGATFDAGAGVGPAAPPATASAPAAGTAEPARVAVVSKVLDAFATGSYAGPGVIGGVARTVIGSQQLPPPGDQAQAALLDLVLEVGGAISENGRPGVDAFREAVAPLACANPVVNAGLEGLADGLDQTVADFGRVIAPFDLTASETATFLRALAAPEVAC